MRFFPVKVIVFLLCLAVAGSVEADEFVTIPATSFEAVSGESGISVTVSVSEFQIARTELTQRQYEAVMQENPSFHKGADLPVENVTWWDAIRYCNQRSEKEGLAPCYDLTTGGCDHGQKGYRLPTNTEWTIACGSTLDIDQVTLQGKANIGSMDTKSVPHLLEQFESSGTVCVGTSTPNEHGLYDMIGNVWEWCTDFFCPVSNYYVPLHNPRGPEKGLNRVIRGTSYLTSVAAYPRRRKYCFSRLPEHHSRFTGFRLCRCVTPRTNPALEISDSDAWFAPYNEAPAGFRDQTGDLSDLLAGAEETHITDVKGWSKKREQLQEKWSRILGALPIDPPAPDARIIEDVDHDYYSGTMMMLRVEPDQWEKIFIMRPKHPIRTPTPVVIVPYYDVDTPAFRMMGGDRYDGPAVLGFAYLMAQQGFVAVAVKSYVVSCGEYYSEGMATLRARYPDVSGLGKWVWDVHRVVDYIYAMDDADHKRIGIIGHSLGGIMALYAGALEPRICVTVSNEPALGINRESYANYWYHGQSIRELDASTDQHELLALVAPRAFLLIGGDGSDKDDSWYYINAARSVYQVYNCPGHIGYINHRRGHNPTPRAVQLATEWLKHFLLAPGP